MKKLLVCNCCITKDGTSVSRYLLERYPEEVISGVKELAEKEKAEILYLVPKGVKIPELKDQAFVREADDSPVMENIFAVINKLNGRMPRPSVQKETVPYFDGKEVVMTTPETAYRVSTQKQHKILAVVTNGTEEFREVPFGTPLNELLDDEKAKYVLLGGVSGKLILAEALDTYTVSEDPMWDLVTVFSQEQCMVKETVQMMEQAHKISCGKCVLCREGMLQFQTILQEVEKGKMKISDLAMLDEMSRLVMDGAYCKVGKAMAGTLHDALQMFHEEFVTHIQKKQCMANVCFSGQMLLGIDPKKCVGCGECIDICEEDAITGKPGFIHMIDTDMCEKCGKCQSVCEAGAIVELDGKKIRLPKKLTKVGKFR